MEKIKDILGVVIFYGLIIAGVLLLDARLGQIKSTDSVESEPVQIKITNQK